MSLWIREGSFECEGCGPAGCIGHESKLTLQDTADIFNYYIDGDLVYSAGLDQMQDFKDMLDSLDYLKDKDG